MPENETLVYDPTTASRWGGVAKLMDDGKTPNEVFPLIQTNVYKAFQRIWKQWKERGIDPAELFEAARSDQKRLEELIKLSFFDRNARLLRDVATDTERGDMERIVGEFVSAAWDSVNCQLQLDRREGSQSLEFVGQVHRMLNRIVSSLLDDPSRFPAQPPRKVLPPDLDTQLAEPLL